ncbi:MAG: hypothetical protein H6910_00145 [Rickettsiaceae bacterium]|nr:hypothetical protein [Rickettsiaceae bacterium]
MMVELEPAEMMAEMIILAPVLLPNGNIASPRCRLFLTVDSIDSDAGYNSSFGHYFADIMVINIRKY